MKVRNLLPRLLLPARPPRFHFPFLPQKLFELKKKKKKQELEFSDERGGISEETEQRRRRHFLPGS